MTGATGNVGREVVRALQSIDAPVSAATTNLGRASGVLGPDVELVAFQFGVPATYAAALTGVRRLFLVRPPAISNARVVNSLVDAAAATGVSQIVFLSLQGAERNPVVPLMCFWRRMAGIRPAESSRHGDARPVYGVSPGAWQRT
ncbi:MAG: NAD(P)H-binding protein [Chloroflexi bacterium]|nr:NAD(P)H-binding protein [Chloroflexota bacterium]